MDVATRAVALQLLAGDINEERNRDKGKKNADAIDDFRMALDLTEAELGACASNLVDRAMAQSIARAVREDHDAIDAAQAQEQQAAEDRQVALQFDRDGRIRPTSPQNGGDVPPPYQNNVDDEFLDKLEVRYNIASRVGIDDDNAPQAESSSRAAARPVAMPRPIRPVTKIRVCVACDDHLPFQELARLPCSHEYCRKCLERVFTDSLTDEALWPPRCCRQRIPAEEDHIRIFLGGQLMGQYLARKLEMETPNRIYCHKPDCSRFIPPLGIKDEVGSCPKCEAKTCTICKGAAHDGHDCPQDTAGQQLMALADQQGWKQCFSCNRIVELRSMSMRCRILLQVRRDLEPQDL